MTVSLMVLARGAGRVFVVAGLRDEVAALRLAAGWAAAFVVLRLVVLRRGALAREAAGRLAAPDAAGVLAAAAGVAGVAAAGVACVDWVSFWGVLMRMLRSPRCAAACWRSARRTSGTSRRAPCAGVR